MMGSPRASQPISKLPDWEYVFPPMDEPIVSMIEFGGHLYVATSRGVYRKDGDKLVPLKLAITEPV
ncbi:MAG TPA: hypothetical protein VKU84_16940 [Stellaceae bacterium]|nr:hypothetical protein [Stellaceae bacterium]